jgi:hypothetical protein
VVTWLKRLAYLLVITVSLAGVAVAVIFLTNPRDESDFVATYAQGRPRLAEDHPERLLRAGDAACDWLNSQTDAVLEPGTDVSDRDLAKRYAAETGGSSRSAAVAFDTLCGGTKVVIQATHPWQFLPFVD